MNYTIGGMLAGTEPRNPLKLAFPPWMEQAECTRANPELFYKPPGRHPGRNGDDGDTVEQQRIADAKSYCSGCLVREQCLKWANENGDEHAIMGGLTPDERRRMKRRNSAAARSEATG